MFKVYDSWNVNNKMIELMQLLDESNIPFELVEDNTIKIINEFVPEITIVVYVDYLYNVVIYEDLNDENESLFVYNNKYFTADKCYQAINVMLW